MTQYKTQLRFPSRTQVEEIKVLARRQQRSMNAQLLYLIQQGMEHEKAKSK
ncbi:Arc family DNA-binding protein [Vreelandella hamiltonii]|uniref:Arc-like DNA binding domain-containing protein n=1 Tax=Vreelandella hamiltonii TaxID=502829 RepID=A0A8H9I204_9GAMM|nr:Arc family DNA-binding protein [Halomonas hamiltonii]GGW23740.1 hypothetical protein GCM10007157_13880 [Halomonas hamiltonii]